MKEKENIILREAYRYFRKKRYNEAIAILEKIVSNEPRSPYPHFLLCVSYLLNSRFNDADVIMNKLRRIDPEFLPLLQLEAFLFLKGAPDAKSAIVKYVEKLEKFSADRHLKGTLKVLERVQDFEAFQKNARLTDHVGIPRPPISPLLFLKRKKYPVFEKEAGEDSRASNSGKIFIKTLIATIVLCAAAGGGYFFYNHIVPELFNDIKEQKGNPDFDALDIDIIRYNLIDKINKDKPPEFYYSDDELLKDFDRARRLIKNQSYNEAIILINKISNSNANYRVMERVEFLRKFIQDIEDRKCSDITINEVAKKPYLYRGLFIKWKGRIANLKRKEDKMFFNLLVDYKNDDIFSGVIDVYSEKDFSEFKNGDMVELRASFINTIGSGSRLYLVAEDIRKI